MAAVDAIEDRLRIVLLILIRGGVIPCISPFRHFTVYFFLALPAFFFDLPAVQIMNGETFSFFFFVFFSTHGQHKLLNAPSGTDTRTITSLAIGG